MGKFKIEYKNLISKEQTKDKANNKIATSRINIYALILFVKDFYDFLSQGLDYKTLKCMTFYGSDDTQAAIKQNEKLITLCERCSKKPQKYIINERYIRKNIAQYDHEAHSKTIKNNLKELYRNDTLLGIINKTEGSQSGNDRNTYILPPIQSLEKHCKNIKASNVCNTTKYEHFKDTASIAIVSLRGIESIPKKEIGLKQKLEKEAQETAKKLYPGVGGMTINFAVAQTDPKYKEIWHSVEYISKYGDSTVALIAYEKGITLIDYENRPLTLTDVGFEIFELSLFSGEWISFRYEDCLIILSPKYVGGDFSQLAEQIYKILDEKSRYKARDFSKILKGYTGDKFDTSALIKYLENSDALLSEKFKYELNRFSRSKLFESFNEFENSPQNEWIKPSIKLDLNLLYKTASPWLDKNMALEDVCLAWYEQKTGFCAKEFIKKYKRQDYKPVIVKFDRSKDIEL